MRDLAAHPDAEIRALARRHQVTTAVVRWLMRALPRTPDAGHHLVGHRAQAGAA